MHIASLLAGYSPDQPGVNARYIRPGEISDRVRASVYARPASSHCYYCSVPLTPRVSGQRQKIGSVGGCGISLDHLVPRFLGGSGDASNLVACCSACNSRKGHQAVEEFLATPWLRGRRKVVARELLLVAA